MHITGCAGPAEKGSGRVAGSKMLPVVVLISGNGSNLQAIIEAIQNQALSIEIRAVISSNPLAPGLQHAQKAGILTQVFDHKTFANRPAFDVTLQRAIDSFDPKLVVLAGFMRVLGTGFVSHYEGRMVNIHPSLLPAFTGLNTHQRALDARATEHGASVHFVTSELDGGPVIIHGRVPILSNDSAITLAQRVLTVEHRIYPLAIHWFAEDRLQLTQGKVIFDGMPLTNPVNYKHEHYAQFYTPR